MEDESPFPRIEPGLQTLLDELKELEPIFHRAAFGSSSEDFARQMTPDYWEIGASGRCYSRDFIVRHLDEHPPVDAENAGWKCADFGLRTLGPDTYLLTYTLAQNERLTRRSTIWRMTGEGWQIVFHQGTVVAAK